MKLLKKEWLQALILILPFCVVGLLWDKIPGQIPVHWDIRGVVDGYGAKDSGVLLFIPALNCGVALLLGLVPRIDPKLRKLEGSVSTSGFKSLKVVRLAVSSLQSIISIAFTCAVAGFFYSPTGFVAILHLGTGLLVLVLGNFMGKLRPNYFVGIRTPWTLESKEVWAATHRFAGRLMVAVGALMIIFYFAVPAEAYMPWVVVPALTFLAVATTLYSYAIHQKMRRTGVE